MKRGCTTFICGAAGMGKTRLAMEFARRMAPELEYGLYVDASTNESTRISYEKISDLLKLEETDRG